MKTTRIFAYLLLLLLATSCKEPDGKGSIAIAVNYSDNGEPLVTDTLRYTNEAGNLYLVSEIQWFTSHFELHGTDGEWIAVGPTINYIDTDIADTQKIDLDNIPSGQYDSIRFTFGLNEADNVTGLFVDAPESNMFWPEPLGGGYHYMKLNGKWLNPDNGELTPLNIHLGIGQNDDFTEFYQNYFIVQQALSINITENAVLPLTLEMVIDNWFRTPNTYNFWPSGYSIMQNQQAQQQLRENGNDVFIIR